MFRIEVSQWKVQVWWNPVRTIAPPTNLLTTLSENFACIRTFIKYLQQNRKKSIKHVPRLKWVRKQEKTDKDWHFGNVAQLGLFPLIRNFFKDNFLLQLRKVFRRSGSSTHKLHAISMLSFVDPERERLVSNGKRKWNPILTLNRSLLQKKSKKKSKSRSLRWMHFLNCDCPKLRHLCCSYTHPWIKFARLWTKTRTHLENRSSNHVWTVEVEIDFGIAFNRS